MTVRLPAARVSRGGRRLRRGSAALVGARQVPVGTIVDATSGAVAVTAATTGRAHLQTGTFRGGRFEVRQSRAGRGLVELRLIDTAGKRACKRSHATSAPRSLGFLRANATGHFRTVGSYASATISGGAGAWSVSDRCQGTLARVTRGSVTVRVFRTKRKKVIGIGSGYLVPAR